MRRAPNLLLNQQQILAPFALSRKAWGADGAK